MRLCFIDLMPWDYDADTPYERPLGGMQSAACHLAAALAAAGHEVALATHTTRPAKRRGVDCLSLDDREALERLRQTRWDAARLPDRHPRPGARSDAAPGVPAFLWTGHADDQPAVQCLSDPAVRDGWDGVVLVSEWQRARYARPLRPCQPTAPPCCATPSLRHSRTCSPDADALARAKRSRPTAAGLHLDAVPRAGPAGRHVPADPPALPACGSSPTWGRI